MDKERDGAALIFGFSKPEGGDDQGPMLMKALTRAQASGDWEKAWRVQQEIARACGEKGGDDEGGDNPFKKSAGYDDDDDKGLDF